MATMNSVEGLSDAHNPTSSSPPTSLRPMTSTGHLSISSPTKSKDAQSPHRRLSHHLKPSDLNFIAASTPSSPTSIHSASSAIFERDIEPILLPSPHTHLNQPPNPHLIPRAKATEQIEHAVPSVLDSAASALLSMDEMEPVAVISPTHHTSSLDLGLGLGLGVGRTGRTSGFSSPRFRSRSPSPLVDSVNERTTPLSCPNQVQSVPAIITPIYGGSSLSPVDVSNSAEETTLAHRPLHAHDTHHPTSPSTPSIASPTSISSSLSSSPHIPKKRLSFISYSDLLSSAPTSTQPLSALMTGLAGEPPHWVEVVGLGGGSRIASSQAGSPVGSPVSPPLVLSSLPSTLPPPTLPTTTMNHSSSTGGPMGGITHPNKPDSIALMDNVGGEWEREGRGRGMEERMEGDYSVEEGINI